MAFKCRVDPIRLSGLWRTLLLTAVAGLLATLAMLWAIRNIRRSPGGEPDEAVQLCRRIADGDLSAVFDSRADSKSLIGALSAMRKNLTTMAARSKRTEEQASALAESASSMEHLTETVNQNAANAHQATQLAQMTSQTVSKGGQVVGDVVAIDVDDRGKFAEDRPDHRCA
jgi:methyl-accepting chemotaxis protein